jgi:hypothetical protein
MIFGITELFFPSAGNKHTSRSLCLSRFFSPAPKRSDGHPEEGDDDDEDEQEEAREAKEKEKATQQDEHNSQNNTTAIAGNIIVRISKTREMKTNKRKTYFA